MGGGELRDKKMATQPVTEMAKNSLRRGVLSYSMPFGLIRFFCSIVVVIKTSILYI